MKLLDGAMVQMMYEFRDGALLRHRLAGGVITLLFLISQRHDIVIGLFVNRYEFGVLV